MSVDNEPANWGSVEGRDLAVLQDEVLTTVREMQEVGRAFTVLGALVHVEISPAVSRSGLGSALELSEVAAQAEKSLRHTARRLNVLKRAGIVVKENDRFSLRKDAEPEE